jgi:predicted nucleotidyltransferase
MGPTMSIRARRAEYGGRLEEALRKAVATLCGIAGVQRVSVFGSYARGRRDLLTDLDLLVVWDTDRPAIDRLAYLYSRLDLGVDLDVVCYTPTEFQEAKPTPFLRGILAEEIVLHETKPA